MPLIQPINPAAPVRATLKTGVAEAQQTPSTIMAQASHHAQDNEIGAKAVEPAAPPSAVQLQIKALMSEQAEIAAHTAQTLPEKAS